MVLGYAGGTMSLSRNYIVPTYLVLALAQAYLLQAARAAPLSGERVDGRLVGRVGAVGLVSLAALFALTNLLVRWE